jgi:stalled ribosome rescue protein Dom34
MNNQHHVAVWIDQHEARVFRVGPDSFDEATFRQNARHLRRHPADHKSEAAQHPDDIKRFFREVAFALEGADEVLVVGPAAAKLHFLKYVHAHHPGLDARIVGIETVDHPTDPQVAAYARKYFVEVDRMRAIVP